MIANTWKDALQKGIGMLLNFQCNKLIYAFLLPIDLILLLEYSFTLVQNNSKHTFPLAVEKYQASGTSVQVSKALDELFVQYSATNNEEEKVRLVMDVILHHHICK